jgi:sugar lactone lactonase YvrE
VICFLCLISASAFALAQTSFVVPAATPDATGGSPNMLPPTNVGSMSAAQTVTITLTSDFTLGGIAVLTQGALNLDFQSASGGTCAVGTAYTAGQKCTVNYKFKPAHPGPRYGAVVLTDNASPANAAATAYLQGTGVGPLAVFAKTTAGNYAPSERTILGSGIKHALGVAVDARGNIFVVDEGNNAVKEILAVNGSIPPSPTIKTLNSGFSGPYGLAVDGAGNLFVGDRGTHSVKEVLAAGGYTTLKTLGSGFSQPNGVAVDGSANVFVADWANNAVYEVLAAGGYTTTKRLGGVYDAADYVAVDGDGNVFVADFSDVKEILMAGGYTTVKTLTHGLSATSCVVVDASGNLFVTRYDGVVSEVLAAGGYTTIKTLASGLDRPNSLTVDGNGNVFASDYGHSNLLRLDYSNPPSLTFATTGSGQTSTDSPQTVTVSNNGNADLDILDVAYAKDFPESVGNDTGCTSATNLSAGGACTLSIDFSPLAASATGLSTSLSEMVSITDNNLNASGQVQSVAVAGTETVTYKLPVLTSPAPGSILSGITAMFTWDPGDATSFQFRLGTSAGASDVYSGGTISQTSVTVNKLPTNGEVLHARLGGLIHGTWQYVDATYTAHTALLPSLTSPVPGSVLSGATATFIWDPGEATSFQFRLGTTSGANDIYGSGTISQTSVTVNKLPANGEVLYARLSGLINGAWQYADVTYTAHTAALALITSPAPGSILSGATATFTWDRGDATSFQFRLGTTSGANDIYGSGTISQTSVTVNKLPINGEVVYARLGGLINGAWRYVDSVYKSGPVLPFLISPAPNSTLTGASQTFTWNPGVGVTAFQLFVGTHGPWSYDIYKSAWVKGTSLDVVNIPTDGSPFYVVLQYRLNGVWSSIIYVCMESGATRAPSMTSPAPGAWLTGASETFTWDPGTTANRFHLRVGTTRGGNDVYDSTVTSATSANVANIPTTGGTLYVRLWYFTKGDWSNRHFVDYTYSEF